jgi:hypothetical protein
MQAVTALFGEKKNKSGFPLGQLKDAAIVGIIVLALSLPPADAIIGKVFSCATGSPYMAAAVKAVLAVVLYWGINKFYLNKGK